MKYTVLLLITLAWLPACQAATAAGRLNKMKAADFFSNTQEVALAEAVARGQIEKIKQLLDQGIDINLKGKDGMTPLLWALIRQNKAGYQYLIERGANPNLTAEKGNSVMSFAAIMEDTDFLRLALKHGGDPNLVNPRTAQTPIYESIDHRRTDNIRLLIKSGADLNFKDRTGMTPLMNAATVIQYQIVYEMLMAGADPTVKNNWGNTVVFLVKKNNVDPKHEVYQWRAKVIELLKERGIKVE